MYLRLPRGFLGAAGVRVQGRPSGHPAPMLPTPPACRCSPLGAVSAQCHENSTCTCRPGFVGYKCDRCRDNFFLTADGTQCQECPSCYGLVRDEVSPPVAPVSASSVPGPEGCPHPQCPPAAFSSCRAWPSPHPCPSPAWGGQEKGVSFPRGPPCGPRSHICPGSTSSGKRVGGSVTPTQGCG